MTASVLLRGQLGYLRDHGFEVTVISSPGPELDLVAEREGVRVIGVPMKREIEPWADLVALERLIRALRQISPDIVNASTAKAGLLGMIAAAALRVPIRVYLLRGLRLETERGLKRATLGATEKLASACASHVVCVSESLREQYVAGGFAPAAKCKVLLAGSSNGVDIDRFDVTASRVAEASRLRRDLGISADARVIGFVGRPVIDKGIVDILDAFERVNRSTPNARLLLVGAGFADDEIDPAIKQRLQSCRAVIVVGAVAEPAPYYALMDVLAFPSHREGFPNVPLEAAAAGVPTVGFRATGVRDAIIDGQTGVLVERGDTTGLARALERYLSDAEVRTAHGRSARERVTATYARARVWAAWQSEYEQMLAEQGVR